MFPNEAPRQTQALGLANPKNEELKPDAPNLKLAEIPPLLGSDPKLLIGWLPLLF